MRHSGDDTKARSNEHGDDPNPTSKLVKLKCEVKENIL
jgi:hypothetical protein